MGYSELYERIGYQFKNEDLLLSALTHPSINNKELENYNRLEYLGDSLIEFLTTEYLFNKFKNADAGTLTDIRKTIVSNKNLINVCNNLELDKLMIKKSKTKINSDSKVYADLVEALYGAIYIDSGNLDIVRKCYIDLIAKNNSNDINNKSYSVLVYEYSQKKKLILNLNWVEQNDSFLCKLEMGNMQTESTGKNKKEAKEKASEIFYKRYINNCR